MSSKDTNPGEDRAEAQGPLSIDGTDFPESFKRCCTSYVRSSVPASDSRLAGMKAILTKASVMWENGRVCISPLPRINVNSDLSQPNEIRLSPSASLEHLPARPYSKGK